jgi:hypothetical protein
MKPVRHAHTNATLGKPIDWDKFSRGEPCGNLPVVYMDGRFYSFWKVTWKEWFALLRGKPVRLCVVGDSHPPVSLDIGDMRA